jgi:hypothetical protein
MRPPPTVPQADGGGGSSSSSGGGGGFCTQCGSSLNHGSAFCAQCGNAVSARRGAEQSVPSAAHSGVPAQMPGHFKVQMPSGVVPGQVLQVPVPPGYPGAGQLQQFRVPAGVTPFQHVWVPLSSGASNVYDDDSDDSDMGYNSQYQGHYGGRYGHRRQEDNSG